MRPVDGARLTAQGGNNSATTSGMPSKKQRAKAAKAAKAAKVANDVQPCSLPPEFEDHDAVRFMRSLANAGILEWEVR